MANNVHRYGFRFYAPLNGPQIPTPETCYVADAYAETADNGSTSIGLSIGDPVRRLADGTVELAKGGETIYGIIVGILPIWNTAAGQFQHTDYVPSATTGGGIFERKTRVQVVRAEQGIWQCDCDDAVTATTEAAYHALQNSNIDHTTAGDTTNASRPKADPLLDISGTGTGTAQWRVHGIAPTVENADFAGLYVKLLVTVNEPMNNVPGGSATGL